MPNQSAAIDPFPAIHWPAGYSPETLPIHERNTLDMAASPAAVWASLVRAQEWPQWYPNSSGVRILNHASGEPAQLRMGTRFRWKTFGVTIDTEVIDFVPEQRIAWSARAHGMEVCHAWSLAASAKGCAVTTEELQRGWLVRLGAIFLPGRMHHFHQIWLENMEKRAQQSTQ